MPADAKPLFRPEALRHRLPSFSLPAAVDAARPALEGWAKRLGSKAVERMKETELLPDFIRDVFAGLLGYTPASAGLPEYTLRREHHVAADGTFADAAVGRFAAGGPGQVVAVVEGKGPKDPLDRPFAGRTESAVRQALGYAVQEQCDWYVVTNLRELRLVCRAIMTSVPSEGFTCPYTTTSDHPGYCGGTLLAAYADGAMLDRGEDREAYLSHFAFGPDLPAQYTANRNSVAGFAGPCRCRRLVLDIDRADDPAAALADARKLVAYLHHRYPEGEGDVPVYFSGGKGYHVLVDLAHDPPPAAGFERVARAFAETTAARAGVTIDPGIYDLAHLIRLPNTRHPKTGLYKRRIDADALLRLDPGGILNHARHPAGDGMPAARRCPALLQADWHGAEQAAARTAAARAARRAADAGTPDARAPRYFVEFLRFLTDPGERHRTLFRCAVWLTEQGAPPSLCSALLTEPGRDAGLSPADVDRQVRCGIEHARRQGGGTTNPRPDPTADPDAFDRWAIQHEAGPLPPGASDFPFGALAPVAGEGGPA